MINAAIKEFIPGLDDRTVECDVCVDSVIPGFTQALATGGRAYGIRAHFLSPGAMATSWGRWAEDEPRAAARGRVAAGVLAEEVADLIVWIAVAPPPLVVEAIVTPLEEGCL